MEQHRTRLFARREDEEANGIVERVQVLRAGRVGETHDEVVEVPETTKWEVAQRVLDRVIKLRKRRPVKA